MIAIKIMCDALGRATQFDGEYIKSFDPDAFNGRGSVVTTADARNAVTFATPADAHSYWTQVSKRFPVRPDGKPNRPLTAYNVELAHLVLDC